MRKAGFIIDVPVTLSVAVRGVSEERAIEIAREFAECLSPSEYFVKGYMDTKRDEENAEYDITEVSLESPSDETAEVIDELEEEDDDEYDVDEIEEDYAYGDSYLGKQAAKYDHEQNLDKED